MGQNTSSAVMAQCADRADRVNYFPTPPWATRALCEKLAGLVEDAGPRRAVPLAEACVWEPACGEGYMARPLAEYFGRVIATDIVDWRPAFREQFGAMDFLDQLAAHFGRLPARPDWIVTNPPFSTAVQFARQALAHGVDGVALLVRTSFLEGLQRHRDLFVPHPPAVVYVFSERVPMVKGRCDPRASTATSYAWVVWTEWHRGASVLDWIGPCRRQLERDSDYVGGRDG